MPVNSTAKPASSDAICSDPTLSRLVPVSATHEEDTLLAVIRGRRPKVLAEIDAEKRRQPLRQAAHS